MKPLVTVVLGFGLAAMALAFPQVPTFGTYQRSVPSVEIRDGALHRSKGAIFWREDQGGLLVADGVGSGFLRREENGNVTIVEKMQPGCDWRLVRDKRSSTKFAERDDGEGTEYREWYEVVSGDPKIKAWHLGFRGGKVAAVELADPPLLFEKSWRVYDKGKISGK